MSLRLPAYFKWRDGRPRWEPGPGLRAKGWIGQDLRSASGDWHGLEAAIAAANAINAEVAHWRRTGERPQPNSPTHAIAPVPAQPPANTCRALIDRWQSSVSWQRRAPATRRDYRNKARYFVARLGDAPVAALTKPVMYAWWEELHRTHGHAMANGVVAVARAALSYAELIGWRAENTNPARNLALPGLPPRVSVWTPAEVAHLVATADSLGEHGIGDAVVIALHSGQRQGDVLALEHEQTAGGRVAMRQAKRGARVVVPATDQLAARLAAIRARRTGGGVVSLASLGRLVLRPDGQPYKADHFRHVFAHVRAVAADSLDDAAAAARLRARTFADLRDTAITRLALAGGTITEIRAITGHSLETVHQVLRHYLALDEASARSGIARLQAWMQREGIAL